MNRENVIRDVVAAIVAAACLTAIVYVARFW